MCKLPVLRLAGQVLNNERQGGVKRDVGNRTVMVSRRVTGFN